jgi:predicted transcriptional regulator
MSAWPQYLMLALLFTQLLAFLIKDRKETTTWERATSVFASFVVQGGMFALLWAGGFWAPIGWPA